MKPGDRSIRRPRSRLDEVIRGESEMSVRRPSEVEIAAAAARVHLSLDRGDIAEFTEMVGATMETLYGPLDLLPDYLPQARYPRLPGYRPDAKEDPLSAWYVKS